MDIKGFLSSANGKVTVAAVAVLILVGIAAAIMMMNSGGSTYRGITAKEVSGSVSITGDINSGQAYSGEKLYSGDDVNVPEQSSITVLIDNNKYIYAEAETHFVISADQTEDHSRIRIALDKGSELNDLRTTLGAGDSFDVDTPNSTLSAKGTKFNASVYTDGDIVYTLLEVSEGNVDVKLRTAGGTYTGTEQTFGAGESVIIRGGSDFSEFTHDENGETVRHLDLSALPTNGTARLTALISRSSDGTVKTEPEPEKAETSEPQITPTEITYDTTEAPEPEIIPETTTEEAPEPAAPVTESTPAVTANVTAAAVETTAPHTHTFGDWTVTTPAGCETEGTETRICTVCGATETQSVPAIGHTFGNWTAQFGANCEEGVTATRKCSVCGSTEEKIIPPTSHRFGEWTVTREANCLIGGTETRTCTVCMTSESRTTPAAGHTFGEWKLSRIATCENGGTERRKCTICGSTEERETPALGHQYGEWKVTSDPGYDVPGTETRICLRCGHIDERNINPLGS